MADFYYGKWILLQNDITNPEIFFRLNMNKTHMYVRRPDRLKCAVIFFSISNKIGIFILYIWENVIGNCRIFCKILCALLLNKIDKGTFSEQDTLDTMLFLRYKNHRPYTQKTSSIMYLLL